MAKVRPVCGGHGWDRSEPRPRTLLVPVGSSGTPCAQGTAGLERPRGREGVIDVCGGTEPALAWYGSDRRLQSWVL